MALVFVPQQWTGIDISKNCKAWRTGLSGTEYRMVTSARAVDTLRDGINHLCARQPRVTFWQYTDPTTSNLNDENAAPLWSHYYDDYWPNGQTRDYCALVMPRNTTNWPFGSDVATISSNYLSGTSDGYALCTNVALQWPQTLQLLEWQVIRNDAASAAVEEKFTVTNGMRVVDCVGQDSPLPFLVTNTHTHSAAAVGPGHEILAGPTESIRDAIHDVRRYNMPIEFQWHAATVGSYPESDWDTTVSGSGVTGLHSYGDFGTWRNPLDRDQNSRTAWTPGFSCHGYKSGRGLSNSSGLRIFLLATSLSGDGIVNFVGPDHRSTNWVSFDLAEDVTPQWTASTGLVYLNTEVDDLCTNTARNKIDVLCHHTPSGDNPTSEVIIYGIVAQREYE